MKKGYKKNRHSGHHESPAPDLSPAAISQACELLLQAEIREYGLMLQGSNYVFLTKMAMGDVEFNAIYKPMQGEAPLWDFPDDSLYKRECAAFIVSQALEWYLVPPTVIRDGPYGVGSMQWFVDATREIKHYSRIARDISVLKKVALFDILVNNADRKAGHFLEGEDGRLWVVDHGLTFNTDPKLRTVLWDFAGQTIPKTLREDVKKLQTMVRSESQLRDDLYRLLDKEEVKAFEFRIKRSLEKPVFPSPRSHRSVPWPWI
ncbi:SCO1664 family protein [Chloroflexota bacterium]